MIWGAAFLENLHPTATPLRSFTALFIFYHMGNTIRSAVGVAAAAWRAGGPSAEFVSNGKYQQAIPDAFLSVNGPQQTKNKQIV